MEAAAILPVHQLGKTLLYGKLSLGLVLASIFTVRVIRRAPTLLTVATAKKRLGKAPGPETTQSAQPEASPRCRSCGRALRPGSCGSNRCEGQTSTTGCRNCAKGNFVRWPICSAARGDSPHGAGPIKIRNSFSGKTQFSGVPPSAQGCSRG